MKRVRVSKTVLNTREVIKILKRYGISVTKATLSLWYHDGLFPKAKQIRKNSPIRWNRAEVIEIAKRNSVE